MSESKKTPGEIYLEKAKSAGLLNGKNESGLRGVAEMLNSPYSLEQMQAQIKRADDERETNKKRNSKSKWILNGNCFSPIHNFSLLPLPYKL